MLEFSGFNTGKVSPDEIFQVDLQSTDISVISCPCAWLSQCSGYSGVLPFQEWNFVKGVIISALTPDTYFFDNRNPYKGVFEAHGP